MNQICYFFDGYFIYNYNKDVYVLKKNFIFFSKL